MHRHILCHLIELKLTFRSNSKQGQREIELFLEASIRQPFFLYVSMRITELVSRARPFTRSLREGRVWSSIFVHRWNLKSRAKLTTYEVNKSTRSPVTCTGCPRNDGFLCAVEKPTVHSITKTGSIFAAAFHSRIYYHKHPLLKFGYI